VKWDFNFRFKLGVIQELTISLHELEFFGYHGLYPEERRAGNRFKIDLDVFFPAEDNIEQLSQTIDYAVLYDLLVVRMKEATPLLETLAQHLSHAIKEKFPVITRIIIRIQKCQMPLAHFSGNISVKYEKKF